jgi:hypothetical protein
MNYLGAMSRTFTFSKAALTAFLDSAYPAPDDSGPIGPFGPIIRNPFLLSAVNPQPLPPGPRDPLPVAGPQRIRGVLGPWLDIWLRQTLEQLQLKLRPKRRTHDSERLQTSSAELSGHVFRPWVRGRRRAISASCKRWTCWSSGCNFSGWADASKGNALQAELNAAADVLFETGAKRLEAAPQATRAAGA